MSSITGSVTARPGMMLQAYRFALDPSPAQERALRSLAGAARFAWNWGLAMCRERHDTERKWYSGMELHRMWNQVKKSERALRWWDQNSKCCYQEAFRDLDRALRDFVKSRNGQRKGRRLGLPWFKKRGRCKDSFRRYPSSKTCSGCDTVKAKLSLSERTYRCDHCGLALGRDVNAARNLLKLAAIGAESLNACRGTARPGTAGHDPVKQEPGTASAGKTGTAAATGGCSPRAHSRSLSRDGSSDLPA